MRKMNVNERVGAFSVLFFVFIVCFLVGIVSYSNGQVSGYHDAEDYYSGKTKIEPHYIVSPYDYGDRYKYMENKILEGGYEYGKNYENYTTRNSIEKERNYTKEQDRAFDKPSEDPKGGIEQGLQSLGWVTLIYWNSIFNSNSNINQHGSN